MMKKKYFRATLLFIMIGMLASCNKEITDRIDLDKEVPDLTLVKSQNKVLYLVIEGGIGSVIAQEATDYGSLPTIGSLAEHSLLSWNSVSSETEDMLTSYGELLTGVDGSKLDPSEGGGIAYPTVFDRIRKFSSLKTSFYSSNSLVFSTFLGSQPEVDRHNLASTDEQVYADLTEELAREDAGFVVGTFSSVRTAGENFGYGPDSDVYMSALQKIDGYIQGLLETLHKRPGYASEKWLIVLTSESGGEYALDPYLDDHSVYSETSRNNFVIFSHTGFKFKLVEKPNLTDPTYDGSAIRYSGSNARASIASEEADIFNLGTSGDYTIQFRIKVHQLGSNNPAIISKQNNTGNADDGWSFIYNGQSGWRFKIKGTHAVDGAAFELGQWYTLTARLWDDEGVRKVTVYTNGDSITTSTINNLQGSSSAPLNLGHSTAWGGGTPQHSIVDVRIYDTALPTDYIQTNYCKTFVSVSDPYFDSLIGYWPAIEGDGDILKDHSASKRDFKLTGTYTWNSFSERGATLCPGFPDGLEQLVIRSLDIPKFVYNWVGILDTYKFDLDSKGWLPVFNN